MSRLVEIKQIDEMRGPPESAGSGSDWQQQLQDYGERVAKYVPVEVLAFYSVAVQLILTKEGDNHLLFRLWAFAIIGLIAWIGTPLYLSMYSKNPKERLVNQCVASVAFGVWAYAYPAGWFAEKGWHDPVIAGLLLTLFTFLSGLIQPKE